jgi:hypothetical protein
MEDFEKYTVVKIHILNEQVNNTTTQGKFRQTTESIMPYA